MGLRRFTRAVHAHGHRLLSIGDDLSSILGFEKGSSRDYALRQLTRSSAARHVACEVRQFRRYSESERKFTDADHAPWSGARSPLDAANMATDPVGLVILHGRCYQLDGEFIVADFFLVARVCHVLLDL